MAVSAILRSFTRALGQLGDARFRKVVLLGVGLSLALLVAATAGFAYLVDWITPKTLGFRYWARSTGSMIC